MARFTWRYLSVLLVVCMASLGLVAVPPVEAESERRAPEAATTEITGTIEKLPAPIRASSPSEAIAAVAGLAFANAEVDAQPLVDGHSELIRAKAEELGESANFIFKFVRDSVVYEPGWGIQLGAEGCLQVMQCSAHDSSLLLSELLRASGFETRFASGIVEVESPLFISAMGDMKTFAGAQNVALLGGLPFEVVNDNQSSVLIAHTWVEIRTKSSSGAEIWRALDASLRRSQHIEPRDILLRAGFAEGEAEEVLDSIADYNPDTQTLTGYDEESLIQFNAQITGAAEDLLPSSASERNFGNAWRNRVARTIGATRPRNAPLSWAKAGPEGQIVGDVLLQDDYPATLMHTVTVALGDNLSVVLASPLAFLNPVTVGFDPASDQDAALIETAGGLWSADPFTVNLNPVLHVSDIPILQGASIPLGARQPVSVEVTDPLGRTLATTNHVLTAGGIGTILYDPVRTTSAVVANRSANVEGVARDLASDDVEIVSLTRLVGDLLWSAGGSYFQIVDHSSNWTSHALGTREVTQPGLALASWNPSFVIEGEDLALGDGIVQIDVQQLGVAGVSRETGEFDLGFFQAVGPVSSAAESMVFETLLGVDSVSTTDILLESSRQGIPTIVIDQSNRLTAIPQLQHPDNIKSAIDEAVQSGRVVFVPQQQITVNNWMGTAWLDLGSSSFGYLLAGGLRGGATSESSPALDALTSTFTTSLTTGLDKSRGLGQVGRFLSSELSLIVATGSGLNAGFDIYNETGEVDKALVGGGVTGGIQFAGGVALAALGGAFIAATAGATVPTIVIAGGVFLMTTYVATLALDGVSKAAGRIAAGLPPST